MTAGSDSEAVPSDGGPLVFVDDLGSPLLDADDHHHLARVRRLRAGDALIVADGCGRWPPAVFADRVPEVVGDAVTEPSAAPPVAGAVGRGAPRRATPAWRAWPGRRPCRAGAPRCRWCTR